MLDLADAPLLTERLVLQPLRPEHAAAMWDALGDPAIYAWFPREPPRELADLEARFWRIAGGRSPDGREQRWLNWTAWDRATDAPVGLVEATAREDGRVAIAYMDRPSLGRRGHGREGVTAVIEALLAAGATAIKAEIDTRNRASLGLVAALGFAFVKRRTAVEWFKGARIDMGASLLRTVRAAGDQPPAMEVGAANRFKSEPDVKGACYHGTGSKRNRAVHFIPKRRKEADASSRSIAYELLIAACSDKIDD